MIDSSCSLFGYFLCGYKCFSWALNFYFDLTWYCYFQAAEANLESAANELKTENLLYLVNWQTSTTIVSKFSVEETLYKMKRVLISFKKNIKRTNKWFV